MGYLSQKVSKGPRSEGTTSLRRSARLWARSPPEHRAGERPGRGLQKETTGVRYGASTKEEEKDCAKHHQEVGEQKQEVHLGPQEGHGEEETEAEDCSKEDQNQSGGQQAHRVPQEESSGFAA